MINEERERIERFLEIVDLIEVYGYYLLRKGIGELYIFVAGIISISLLLVLPLETILPNIYLSIAIVLIFIIASSSTLFACREFILIPYLYVRKPRKEKKIEIEGVFWSIASIVIVLTFITIWTGLVPPTIAPFTVGVMVGFGNIGNYVGARGRKDYPGKVSREYLVLGVIIIMGSFLALLLPQYGWYIITIVALLGTFLFGVYILLTASKVLEQRGSIDEQRGFREDI